MFLPVNQKAQVDVYIQTALYTPIYEKIDPGARANQPPSLPELSPQTASQKSLGMHDTKTES